MRLICSECGISCFNPRTRRGCDPVAIDIVLDPVPGFNPRTRRGCDEVIFNRDILINEFQSTHPQGVRLGCLLNPIPSSLVSIHAPAGGATSFRYQDRL